MSARKDKAFETEQAEAAHCAFCLLMPASFVKAELAARGGLNLADEKACKELARHFQVSETMLGYRLAQLEHDGELAL